MSVGESAKRPLHLRRRGVYGARDLGGNGRPLLGDEVPQDLEANTAVEFIHPHLMLGRTRGVRKADEPSTTDTCGEGGNRSRSDHCDVWANHLDERGLSRDNCTSIFSTHVCDHHRQGGSE